MPAGGFGSSPSLKRLGYKSPNDKLNFAAIGAGGLGQYIFRGVSMVSHSVILAGAVPAAVLALIPFKNEYLY